MEEDGEEGKGQGRGEVGRRRTRRGKEGSGEMKDVLVFLTRETVVKADRARGRRDPLVRVQSVEAEGRLTPTPPAY